MKLPIIATCLLLLLAGTSVAYAQMTSSSFRIEADGFSTGGGNDQSSASYGLRDTVADPSGGFSSSSSYNLRSGFRSMIFDEIVTIDLAAQETGVSTSATGLSSTTITTADTSSFSVGDYIFLVQDVSSTHLAAIGKITSISAGVSITVDQLVSSSSLTIDGTDDMIYRANGTSIGYGTLSSSSVTRRLVGWEVTADTPNGLSVYVAEDTNLTTGAVTIPDVSDGTVTAGSNEFGGRSSDTSLTSSTFDSQDTGITSAPQEVGSVSGTVFDAKGLLDMKVAISSSAISGSYAHNLFFIVAPTY